ncbi:MAG: effector binding domain-containing protein [Eubacteriales bacterium]|nr:effector binding domain-containing protein [Lachnospiraceae bacterium]MDO5126526.1 effector binding domain-containing protein [Eubacteriales bacterium]
MEWLSCVRKTIEYLELHLLEKDCVQDASVKQYLSPMLLQKGFQVMTGYSMSTYVRNRRLYLAALDLKNTDDKIIDIAFKYGFETPESFTKAFTRFHGANPSQIRKGAPVKSFLPLRIHIVVQGGDHLDCQIQTNKGLKVAGYVREFHADTSEYEIPKFWDEVLLLGEDDFNYGICIDDIDTDRGVFHYMIAREYTGEQLADGMHVFEIPEREWATFECEGKIPEAIQELDRRIWNEWLPGNEDYELEGNISLEIYGKPNAIWIPVKERR